MNLLKTLVFMFQIVLATVGVGFCLLFTAAMFGLI